MDGSLVKVIGLRQGRRFIQGGYYELLEALNNPRHESHQEMLDWLGEPFDPGRFNLQEVNAILRGLNL